jgi:hypothetical protein
VDRFSRCSKPTTEHSSLLVTVGLIVVIYIRLSDAEK